MCSLCRPGGHVHKPCGGEGENPRGAEAVAGGRLGPHHSTEAGFRRNKAKSKLLQNLLVACRGLKMAFFHVADEVTP